MAICLSVPDELRSSKLTQVYTSQRLDTRDSKYRIWYHIDFLPRSREAYTVGSISSVQASYPVRYDSLQHMCPWRLMYPYPYLDRNHQVWHDHRTEILPISPIFPDAALTIFRFQISMQDLIFPHSLCTTADTCPTCFITLRRPVAVMQSLCDLEEYIPNLVFV